MHMEEQGVSIERRQRQCYGRLRTMSESLRRVTERFIATQGDEASESHIWDKVRVASGLERLTQRHAARTTLEVEAALVAKRDVAWGTWVEDPK